MFSHQTCTLQRIVYVLSLPAFSVMILIAGLDSLLGARLKARRCMDSALCQVRLCSDRCAGLRARAYFAAPPLVERVILRGNP